MAFASLIHHSSFHSPLRFSARIFRVRTSFSSSNHFDFSSIGRDVFFSPSDGGRRCYCIRSHRLQCFKERSQEGGKFAEEMQIDGHQSCDEDNNIKHAASDISLGRRNGTTDRQSSIRIVSLCVLGAVTFGIALGVKDGVDKASEYFAGKLQGP